VDAATERDLVSAALDDLHVTAIQELDGAWRVFFASDADRAHAAAALRGAAGRGVAVAPEDVPDEDWARRSQEGLGPVRVGRVVIAPPWAAGAAPPDGGRPAGATVILVLPSMGFGTGHHASTRLCVALLQEIDLRGRRVLDVGTGSGVLALVAHALGAGSVVAVDHDADAVAAARDNFDLNHVSGIDLRLGDFRDLSGLGADVVTANLTGGLLLRGAPRLLDAVGPFGWLVVSGVTADEQAEVAGAFHPALRLVTALAEDGWVGLLLHRSQGSAGH
jgi:ribosomal protein L11 methyltransferase